MNLPVSRGSARLAGSVKYFTGRACKRGHLTWRYTSTGQCHLCLAEHTAAYLAADPGAAKRRSQLYNARHPERRRESSRRHAAANREKRRASHRSWCARNPGYFSEWKASNKERVNAYTRNRRALLNGADGAHSAADVTWLLHAQRRRCAACRSSLANGFHVDHVLAVSRGGSNTRQNLQLLCPTCNCQKATKPAHQFMRSKGYLL